MLCLLGVTHFLEQGLCQLESWKKASEITLFNATLTYGHYALKNLLYYKENPRLANWAEILPLNVFQQSASPRFHFE